MRHLFLFIISLFLAGHTHASATSHLPTTTANNQHDHHHFRPKHESLSVRTNDKIKSCQRSILKKQLNVKNHFESRLIPKFIAQNTVKNKQSIMAALITNWFYIAEVIVLLVAKVNPQVGKTGGVLKPEFLIDRIGVIFIFFINGLSLSFPQLQAAGSEWKTHSCVQIYNLLVIPLIAYIIIPNIFNLSSIRNIFGSDTESLSKGLLCLFSLPCTINICITLTQAANADVVTAIFNAVIGNIIGVFWTPIIVYSMLRASSHSTSLADTLIKLGKLVIMPIIIGQATRYTPIGRIIIALKSYTKFISELILLGVVLNTFSDTFIKGFSLSSTTLAILTSILATLYLLSNLIFWNLLNQITPTTDLKTRIAATICSSQKTLAFGIPFIKTTFSKDVNVATILTPLLLWYPIQVFLGSFVIVKQSIRLVEESEGIAIEGSTNMHITDNHNILKFRAGVVRNKVLRRNDVNRSHKYVDGNVEKIRNKLRVGKIKTILSVVCAFCILIDFLEELPEESRYFVYIAHLKRRMHLGSGLLLLTLSTMLQTMFDLLEQIEYHQEIHEERLKFKEALEFFQGSFYTDKDAAKAFDKAALAVFGPNAVTNFGVSGQSTKHSKYRGVVWSTAEECWKVDSSMFLH